MEVGITVFFHPKSHKKMPQNVLSFFFLAFFCLLQRPWSLWLNRCHSGQPVCKLLLLKVLKPECYCPNVVLPSHWIIAFFMNRCFATMFFGWKDVVKTLWPAVHVLNIRDLSANVGWLKEAEYVTMFLKKKPVITFQTRRLTKALLSYFFFSSFHSSQTGDTQKSALVV